MKKIMVNTSLKFLRQSAKTGKLLTFDPGENLPDGVSEEDDNAYPEVSKEFLLQLITELPLGYRTVFNFYVMENYSHKQIAEMLDCTENTSKSQLSKARAWLKKRIIEQENQNSYGKKAASIR